MVTSAPARRRSRRGLLVGGAVVVVVVIAVGMYLFQPWKLWTDTTVNESLPGAGAGAGSSPAASAQVSPPASGPASASPAAAGPRTLATGAFISYEHKTTGTARVIELPSGQRFLRLENLDTSDGPDVRVWFSSKPHTAGLHGFSKSYLELGRLKGNKGNQNYVIPAGSRLGDYRSVVIWCKRFSVAFGAAPLTT
jgi:hypothetical protein